MYPGRVIMIMVVVSTLAACSTAPVGQAPPPIPGASVTEPEGAPKLGNDPQSARAIEPTTAEPTQPAAVRSFIAQAESARAQGDHGLAIEFAEQGLRIDRREPGFYLLLSEIYEHLGDTELAQQFAMQGLRLVSPGDRDMTSRFNLILNR